MTTTERIDPRVIARIRERYDISAVASRLGFSFRKSGHEYLGLCPWHNERSPSWTLNDAKGFCHCFGCGTNQDTIGLVMGALGLPFVDALRWLDASELPPVDPVVRQEQERATRAAKLEQVAAARRFFEGASPVRDGDPVSVYLRARAIENIPPTWAVRFGNVPAWQDQESKEWGPPRPAMLCAAHDAQGGVCGIQRVFFLRDDPALGKADKPKRSLGSIRGHPCRLTPASPHITLAEGPEDGLSIMEIEPLRGCWIAFGTSQMPYAAFPPSVRQVTLAGQNDDAGRAAVQKAGEELARHGEVLVRAAYPPAPYGDWNDLLRGMRSDG